MIFSLLTISTVASDTNESIIIDGKPYTIERILTNSTSRAIASNPSTGTIVADFTYVFESGVLIDNLLHREFVPTRTIAPPISTHSSADDDKYIYRYSEEHTFILAELSTVAIAAAITAKFPGVGVAVVSGVVAYAITKGLSSLTVKQDVYTYTENHYYHIKRVTSIYDNKGSLIGGPWSAYQTVREK